MDVGKDALGRYVYFKATKEVELVFTALENHKSDRDVGRVAMLFDAYAPSWLQRLKYEVIDPFRRRHNLTSDARLNRLTDMAEQSLLNADGGYDREASLRLADPDDTEFVLKAIEGQISHLEQRLPHSSQEQIDLARSLVSQAYETSVV